MTKKHYHDTDLSTFDKVTFRFHVKDSHAVILPSYHEGLSNVLLEAASTGRPVLATRVPGCSEAFDDWVSGIGFESKNQDSLTEAIIEFVKLPHEQKRMMGIMGRLKMEREFDRSIVVNAYMDEINRTMGMIQRAEI